MPRSQNYAEAEKNNLEETIYAAIEEAKKRAETEIQDEGEAKPEKNNLKNIETANGNSQKPEEEQASPKKKRKGEKKEVVSPLISSIL